MTRPAPLRSPFEPLFAGESGVPAVFAEPFFHAADDPYSVRLEGTMHRVWHRPAALRPVFWLLGKLGILVPHVAEDVPMAVDIRPERSAAHGPVQVWERAFAFPRPVRFRTTTLYDPELGRLVDLVGPGDLLYMAWETRRPEPGRFDVATHSCAVRIGGRKLWLPRGLSRLLFGTMRFTQAADPDGGGTMRIDLLIEHPLFGKIFGYEATLRAVRVAKPEGD